MERCKDHRRYKGLNMPQCGGYDGPCQACMVKYKKVQEDLRINGAKKFKEMMKS